MQHAVIEVETANVCAMPSSTTLKDVSKPVFALIGGKLANAVSICRISGYMSGLFTQVTTPNIHGFTYNNKLLSA